MANILQSALNDRLLVYIATDIRARDQLNTHDIGNLIRNNGELADIVLSSTDDYSSTKQALLNTTDPAELNNLKQMIVESLEDKTRISINYDPSADSSRDTTEFRQHLQERLQSVVTARISRWGNLRPDQFMPDDLIVMTESANSNYRYTLEGSEGVVLRSTSGHSYLVRFTKLTGTSDIRENHWEVSANHMKLRKSFGEIIDENGGIEQHTYKLIDEAIVSVVGKMAVKTVNAAVIKHLTNVLIDYNFVHYEKGKLKVRTKIVTNAYKRRSAVLPPIQFKEASTLNTTFRPKYAILGKKTGYRSMNMNAPLAEQTDNVVQFEYTAGCSHNRCTYCDLFKGEDFYQKSSWEFRRHVKKVMRQLSSLDETSTLTRIFIGGGDALSVETELLNEGIVRAIKRFRKGTGRLPKRISMYGSVKNILKKGTKELKYLHCGGTCRGTCSKDRFGTRLGLELIYLGMETGNNELLKLLNKGHTEGQLYEAIDILNDSGSSGSDIRVSAFVMPGLGGMKYCESHVQDTLKALRKLQPGYINLMTIMEHPGSAYGEWMDKAKRWGRNRRLTADETGYQIADIIDGLDFPTTIGCFDNSGYLGNDTNRVHFPSVKLTGLGDEAVLAQAIRYAIKEGCSVTDYRFPN